MVKSLIKGREATMKRVQTSFIPEKQETTEGQNILIFIHAHKSMCLYPQLLNYCTVQSKG